MGEGQVPGSALAPYEVAARLQGQVADGITWSRRRKTKFRRSASAIRIVSLVLAVSSTIILGLQQLNFWTGLAFSFVAVGTLVSAVEPFFNWRSRWILMEEAQYKLQRIRDELEYYLLKTPAANVVIDDLDPFFERLQDVWTDTSERWLAYRRGGQTGSE
jgi:Zn-dependent protease with chaperone function